ncbi:hypothetical protein ABT59_10450 [Enterococcus cecorum]|uniref:DUF3102 domain-containing protein n=1 Tax=Enterococcus cecorum TaxID=44008 RepID=UPI0006412D68|nr:DUF3102 domain-containing protein [Enterococcus cecorum]KLN91524.1 hypothetical protein ABT59_10450 [Enterococcus cecorum]KLN92426.1 hypothetical protein ABT60_08135 [Enterococcus cecorum]
MNELSTDLNVITAEINSFKQIAGQSIWEIGRRLNYVKEHDLAHGEFMKWLNSIGFEQTEANRFMKVANELPNSATLHNLGSTALYLIATLPEEEREKEHTTSNGETKTVDEMTVRELQELKKQLKEKDKQIKNLSNVASDLDEKLSQERLNRKEKIVEKVIEKIPDDYEQLKSSDNDKTIKINDLTRENDLLKQKIKRRNDIELAEEKQALLQEKQLERIQREADIDVYKLIININKFVEAQANYQNDNQIISTATKDAKDKLLKAIERTEKMFNQMKKEIGGEVTWIIN